MILVEADVSEEWDSRTDWATLADRCVRSAVAHSRHSRLGDSDVEVSVKLTTNAEVRALNVAWRGKDQPTNVLSFPMVEEARLGSPAERLLGDIVLAQGVCAGEAQDKAVAIEDHAAHLIVHGTLHLLGYDHETSAADAEEMEQAERRALAAIGVADPYAVEEVHT